MSPSFLNRCFRYGCVLSLAGALRLSAGEGLASEPLAPRSGPAGATLFTTLAPAETGIMALNAYDDPAMWGQRYREFSLGAIGTGVAIGDYDGDGRPDVFVVRKTGTNALFRNLGGCRFEDVSERAGVAGPLGAWKQGATFADVDNDGRLDLYVCRWGAPNLLYLNQGDGTFREEAAQRGLALVDASSMAAFCDYDRDGWLDVYVQTNLLDGERRPNGQRDRLYRNTGGGRFIDVTEAAGLRGETQGHSVTWWDYNEDGWPDAYVANDFKDPDQLYRNNRDGTFTNVLSLVVPHTPHSSMGADLGDVNNDGHIDLLVADMAATTREKDHRGMAKLRAGLRDDEARPDAAPQFMRNALYLNTGAGVMQEAAFLTGLAATDWTWAVRFEDLDNDGRLDAYFTNGMIRELHNLDVVQQMSAKESMTDRVRVMKASPVLAERHLAYRNIGDLRFADHSVAWGLDHVGVSFGAAWGDLDGDGDLDLVFAGLDAEPTVCRNDGAGGHAVTIALRGTTSNRFGVGATVRVETAAGRQVRTLTLARGYLSSSEPRLHFGLGDATSIARLTVEWPGGRVQTFTDLAADRRYTLTEPAEGPVKTSTVSAPQFVEMAEAAHLATPNRERPSQELNPQPLLPFRFSRPGPPALFAKLDRDEEDELVLGGVAGESGQMFSNLGGGQFLAYGSSLFSQTTSVADGPMVTVDADGDGYLDIFVSKAGVAAPANSSYYQPRLLVNDGTGRFSVAPEDTIPSLLVSAGAVVAADFDHTGQLGVFVGGRVVPGKYPFAPASALMAWREDRFVDITADAAPRLANRGMVVAALWTDVDGDTWPDLLVAYDWGPVACYRNVDGKFFEDVSERLGFAAAGAGWWRSLAAADFNQDGRVDYVVGNVGLNTRYQASSDQPVQAYAGVVFGGSAAHFIEVENAGGRQYPLRPRDTLARVFPSIGRRFTSADEYARTPVDEVLPHSTLVSATKFSVTELQSGVFLSQPDGTFRFTPLPRMAQLAPVYGLAAGDFDGDGRADIVLAGNSYAPVAELGRFDGGVGGLFRGDGRGGFTFAPPAESGLVVRRDAKALALVDFNQDGWPDVFVTRNNDRPLAYSNRGVRGRNSFGVSLRGLPGNPAAVGARLTLTLADGSTQTAEVAAGSGYFSQSSATLFFGYPDAAKPRSLKIRWPDGRETVQAFPTPPVKIIRFSAP